MAAMMPTIISLASLSDDEFENAPRARPVDRRSKCANIILKLEDFGISGDQLLKRLTKQPSFAHGKFRKNVCRAAKTVGLEVTSCLSNT
jgi:hypothetical protein